jgi:hypothetical protein
MSLLSVFLHAVESLRGCNEYPISVLWPHIIPHLWRVLLGQACCRRISPFDHRYRSGAERQCTRVCFMHVMPTSCPGIPAVWFPTVPVAVDHHLHKILTIPIGSAPNITAPIAAPIYNIPRVYTCETFCPSPLRWLAGILQVVECRQPPTPPQSTLSLKVRATNSPKRPWLSLLKSTAVGLKPKQRRHPLH